MVACGDEEECRHVDLFFLIPQYSLVCDWGTVKIGSLALVASTYTVVGVSNVGWRSLYLCSVCFCLDRPIMNGLIHREVETIKWGS